MKEILYVQRYGTGYLAKGISDNEARCDIRLVDIRGAVVPPVENQPGYFLFLGMKDIPNSFNKYPLQFMSEGHSDIFSELIDNLANDAGRLKASIIYCERPLQMRASHGFFKDLWDYRYENDLSFQVKPAVSPKDYDYGQGLVNEWTSEKALIRPLFVDTILSSQIASENGLSIDSDIKESQWYAFHALRFLLAGFVKQPPAAVRQTSSTGYGDRYDKDNILLNRNVGPERSLKGWT